VAVHRFTPPDFTTALPVGLPDPGAPEPARTVISNLTLFSRPKTTDVVDSLIAVLDVALTTTSCPVETDPLKVVSPA
jgi:hypothetical protein